MLLIIWGRLHVSKLKIVPYYTKYTHSKISQPTQNNSNPKNPTHPPPPPPNPNNSDQHNTQSSQSTTTPITTSSSSSPNPITTYLYQHTIIFHHLNQVKKNRFWLIRVIYVLLLLRRNMGFFILGPMILRLLVFGIIIILLC